MSLSSCRRVRRSRTRCLHALLILHDEHLFEIDFEPIGKRVDVAPGTDLLDAARQAGIGLASVCGGEGTCGRCRVVIMSGNVTPPVDADRRFFSQLELVIRSAPRLPLSGVHSDVKVHVPKASLVTDQRLQVDGAGAPTANRSGRARL